MLGWKCLHSNRSLFFAFLYINIKILNFFQFIFLLHDQQFPFANKLIIDTRTKFYIYARRAFRLQKTHQWRSNPKKLNRSNNVRSWNYTLVNFKTHYTILYNSSLPTALYRRPSYQQTVIYGSFQNSQCKFIIFSVKRSWNEKYYRKVCKLTQSRI